MIPLAVQAINIPGDQVDVNVHPTKHEVVFLHQEEIISSISAAVEEVLLGPVRYSTGCCACLRDPLHESLHPLLCP